MTQHLIMTGLGLVRECCANCKWFEDHRELDSSMTGICEWFGENEYDDPVETTCFEFEIREEEQ